MKHFRKARVRQEVDRSGLALLLTLAGALLFLLRAVYGTIDHLAFYR